MPKDKCDLCDNPAVVHETTMRKGVKKEIHLCEQHAAEEGLAIKSIHTPINELLTNFVKIHSDVEIDDRSPQNLRCGECGLKFSEFRKDTLLGCPGCYKAFESTLSTLLERAHEVGTHHIGKVPRRAGAGEQRQALLMRMRKQLNEAVVGEDYELAARLRDDIRRFEGEVI